MPAGRPSKYDENPEWYHEKVKQLSLLGATDEEIAQVLDISERTLNYWKKKHPELLQALKEGRDDADAKVADSLYRRALGYSHEEDKIFLFQGKPVIVKTVKHYPPDPTSMIFWLKNRQRENWRDRRDADEPEDSDEIKGVKVTQVDASSDKRKQTAERVSGPKTEV